MSRIAISQTNANPLVYICKHVRISKTTNLFNGMATIPCKLQVATVLIQLILNSNSAGKEDIRFVIPMRRFLFKRLKNNIRI